MIEEKKIYVKWKDAATFSNLDLDEIKQVELVTTENIGFLVDETKEFVVLSFGFWHCIEIFDGCSGIKQHRKLILIPKCQIVEMYELKKK